MGGVTAYSGANVPLFSKFPLFMAKITKTKFSVFCLKVTNMMRFWNRGVPL